MQTHVREFGSCVHAIWPRGPRVSNAGENAYKSLAICHSLKRSIACLVIGCCSADDKQFWISQLNNMAGVELFIERVREHSVLYDFSHDSYKDTLIKNNAWKDVIRDTDIKSGRSTDQCSSQCNNLILLIIIFNDMIIIILLLLHIINNNNIYSNDFLELVPTPV